MKRLQTIFLVFVCFTCFTIVSCGCCSSNDYNQALVPKGSKFVNTYGRGFDVRIYTGPRSCRKSITMHTLLLAGWGETMVSRVQNVMDIDFSIPVESSISVGEIYGQSITVSNFTMILRGMFRPPHDKIHIFEMTASTAALFRVGDIEGSDTRFDIISRRSTVRKMYSLKAGVSYPIHIGYINQFDDAVLQINCVLENGDSVDLAQTVFYGLVNREDLKEYK